MKYAYGKRYIKVIVRDSFNFDEYRKILDDMNLYHQLSVVANNFGFSLQEADILIPYDWNVSFTYYY